MRVSIITVCLNAVDTIEDTINSVFSQNYENIEYIIVDGGSSDGTLKIIDKYKSRLSKFLSERDSGVYEGMNKGVKISTGDIIGFLNADDIYADGNVISTVVRTLQRKNVDACWGDVVYVSYRNINKLIRYWESSEYREGLFRKGWMPPHPTFFVKKWVYENYGFFNLKFSIAADYELMLRFLEKYKLSSYYIPKVLVKMRTGGLSNKNIITVVRANLECYKAWKENGLKISPLRIWLKPLSKFQQFIKARRFLEKS